MMTNEKYCIRKNCNEYIFKKYIHCASVSRCHWSTNSYEFVITELIVPPLAVTEEQVGNLYFLCYQCGSLRDVTTCTLL